MHVLECYVHFLFIFISMNRISCFLILLVPLFASAQTLMRSGGSLANWEVKVSHEFRQQAFDFIAADSSGATLMITNSDPTSIKMIDFNNDGLIDPVYTTQMMGMQYLLLFVNTGSSFEYVTAMPNEISFVSEKNNNDILFFAGIDYPCCGAIFSVYSEHYPLKTDSSLTYETRNRIFFMEYYKYQKGDVAMPVTTPFNIDVDTAFVHDKPGGTSTSSFIDEDSESDLIAIYPRGAAGFVIAQRTLSDGSIWLAVVFDNAIKPYNNDQLYVSNSGSLMGWIRAKDATLLF